jgi:hypothetical protein
MSQPKSRTKNWVSLILLVAFLPIFINWIAGFIERPQWVMEAAESGYRERGLRLDEVTGTGNVIKSTFWGRTAEVRFRGLRQNQPTAIHVTLTKPLNILGWRVNDVWEEPGK